MMICSLRLLLIHCNCVFSFQNFETNGSHIGMNDPYFQTLLKISLNTCLECRLADVYKKHINGYDCTISNIEQHPFKLLVRYDDVTVENPSTDEIVEFFFGSCAVQDKGIGRSYTKADLEKLVNILKLTKTIDRVHQIYLFFFEHTWNTRDTGVDNLLTKVFGTRELERDEIDEMKKMIEDKCPAH